MKRNSNYRLIFLLGLTLFSISCNKDEGPFYADLVNPVDTVEVSFSGDIQPIFNTYCTACHNESHAKLNLISCCSYEQLWEAGFSAPYIDTMNIESGNLYKHITGSLSAMPPSGLMPEYEINKIYQWIAQGAENN
ncbi:MAG: hypothetical protein IPM77_17695 [Crocinitomicaceae bacterium]|nr:hypothetical protein [Crocinitomicaceae bacterium]